MRRALRSRGWRALARDRRGIAAVEFALVVPVVIVVYLAGFEAMEAATVYRKLTDTTVQIANTTSQYTTMGAVDVANVLNASAQIMTPYPTTNLTVVLSEVEVTDNSGVGHIVWTQQCQSSTSTVTMPSGFQTVGAYYILAQTTYAYQPMIGGAFVKPITMTNQIFMLPRGSPSIPCTG